MTSTPTLVPSFIKGSWWAPENPTSSQDVLNAITGEPIYRTPVSYWMPFIGGAVGFHDASWQAAANFSNPSAFYSVGSHGCINLPPEKAAELFDLVSEGLCVVVHT